MPTSSSIRDWQESAPAVAATTNAACRCEQCEFAIASAVSSSSLMQLALAETLIHAMPIALYSGKSQGNEQALCCSSLLLHRALTDQAFASAIMYDHVTPPTPARRHALGVGAIPLAMSPRCHPTERGCRLCTSTSLNPETFLSQRKRPEPIMEFFKQ